MKWFVTIILLTTSLYVYAYQEIAFSLLESKASSISRAMGMGYTSVADIWHNDPLLSIENPAIPALHDGVAFGYSNDRVDPKYDKDTYYNSSMVTLGYKGIGVALPFYNANHKFGTHYDTGEYEYQGEGYAAWWYKDDIKTYGVSYNPIKYLRANAPNQTGYDSNLNLSIGINYNDLYTYNRLQGGCKRYYSNYTANSHSIDAGLLVSDKIKFLHMFDLEGSLGFKKNNLEDAEIKCSDGVSRNIGSNNVFGAGIAVSLPLEEVVSKDNPLNELSSYFVTGRILASRNISKDLEEVSSAGLELGLLDLVYVRMGYYNISHYYTNDGFTGGFGLKFNYRQLFALEGNYARYGYWGNESDEESWDFVLSFDAVKIYDGLTN